MGIKDKLNTMVLQGVLLTPSLQLVCARDDAPPYHAASSIVGETSLLLLHQNLCEFFEFFGRVFLSSTGWVGE